MKAEYKNAILSKKKICSAYLNLLVSKGNSFTVTDIVKLAQINRGTFYLHYSSLADVEQSIEEDLAKNFKVLEQDFRKIEIDKSPEIIVNKLNEILSKDIEFYKLIIKSKNTYHFVEKIKNYIIKSISNNFMMMRYVMNYENFKIVVQYIVSGVLDTYIDWFKGNISCSIEEISDVLCKMIKGGLRGYLNYGY